MKNILLFLFILIIKNESKAQTWLPFEYKLNVGVQEIYCDTIDNLLYIGGPFAFIDADTVMRIFAYDGSDTIHLSNGLRSRPFLYGGYVGKVIRYNNKIYAVGLFDQAPPKQDTMYSIASWNGSEWDTVFTILGSVAFGLNICDDTLYVSGLYDSIKGLDCEGVLAYYYNEIVKCYNNFPDPNHRVSGVIKYNNELYCYGLINDTLNQLAFCKWNTSELKWERVANAFLNDGFAAVADAIVYKNELYICGQFYASQYVAGRGIMKYDGTQWYSIGDIQGFGYDLEIRDGILYVAGDFYYAGNVYSPSVVAYDGNNWIALNNDEFNGSCLTMEFYNDELWIGGSFYYLGGDSDIIYIAKYNLELPSNTNQINKIILNISPNPVSNQLHISIPNLVNQKCSITIYNTMGEVVKDQIMNTQKSEIDISSLMSGFYFISVRGDDGSRVSKKFVKE